MELEFTRIKNDVNGNPRYVVHFLSIASTYPDAVSIANKIGGRKYHTKSYGGGIVFQSYSLGELTNAINRVSGRQYDQWHTGVDSERFVI